MIGGSFQMEVKKGLVYPHQTLLDDIQIDASAFVVVKVKMVHENVKNMKLEVPPDDTTLTLWDAITRRVLWGMTYNDVDPSATASASTTASQLNTASSSIFPKTQSDQMQSCSSPIQEQLHRSPPQNWSTLLPAPDQTQPLLVCQRRQRMYVPRLNCYERRRPRQPLQQTTMTQTNPKYVRGHPMLTIDHLHEAGQYCVDLHN
jgi:hypothetical protein